MKQDELEKDDYLKTNHFAGKTFTTVDVQAILDSFKLEKEHHPHHEPEPHYPEPEPYHPEPEPYYHPEPEPYHPEPEPYYHPEPEPEHHYKNPYEHIIPVGGFSSFGTPPGGYTYDTHPTGYHHTTASYHPEPYHHPEPEPYHPEPEPYHPPTPYYPVHEPEEPVCDCEDEEAQILDLEYERTLLKGKVKALMKQIKDLEGELSHFHY